MLNLSVNVYSYEIDLIGRDNGKEFVIELNDVGANDELYGLARWGDMESGVSLYKN